MRTYEYDTAFSDYDLRDQIQSASKVYSKFRVEGITFNPEQRKYTYFYSYKKEKPAPLTSIYSDHDLWGDYEPPSAKDYSNYSW